MASVLKKALDVLAHPEGFFPDDSRQRWPATLKFGALAHVLGWSGFMAWQTSWQVWGEGQLGIHLVQEAMAGAGLGFIMLGLAMVWLSLWFHGAVWLTGGAPGGFQGTLSAVCHGGGSMALLLLFPLAFLPRLGPLSLTLVAVGWLGYQILGLRIVHSLAWPRALFVGLSPFVFAGLSLVLLAALGLAGFSLFLLRSQNPWLF